MMAAMGHSDDTIWLCPRCMTAISNLEYEHLNKDGLCKVCETTLVQYSKILWTYKGVKGR